MFYKIVDKETEIYKKLHRFRSREKEIEETNKKLIKEKIGLEYDTFLGKQGQQNINRVTQYDGFGFKNPAEVDDKVWIRHDEHKDIFIPYKRTKAGREMYNFLRHELKSSSALDLIQALGIDVKHRFKIPYLEIIGDVLILAVDEELKADGCIEITKKEFDEILKEGSA